MTGYQPISVEAIANVGLSALPAGSPWVPGRLARRGFPFEVGADPQRCFHRVSSNQPAAEVSLEPVGRATWIIVAHLLTKPTVLAGGPAARQVGRYVFRYRDGHAEAASIRERLEVSHVPQSGAEWGHPPLLAVPDAFDAVPPHRVGEFAATGHRMTGAAFAPAAAFLWGWQNPYPERGLSAIEFHSADVDAGLVCLGVAAGILDENPLRLRPAQPIVIDVDPGQLGIPESIEVTLDRGVSSLPVAVRAADPPALLTATLPGWGADRQPRPQRHWITAAALPSATLSVASDETIVGSIAWSMLLERSDVTSGAVRIRSVEDGRNWVTTTVVDDATGGPIPCRVHFRSPAGVPYQPHGHPPHANFDLNETNARTGQVQGAWSMDVGGDVRLGALTYAYIDGTCEGWLPRGDVIVDVAKGFEYEPVRTRMTIEPGQRNLEVRLKRATDMAARGWYSGDTHVHFLSVDGAHLEAAGEGVNVINLLAAQWGRMFSNTEDFTGTASVRPDTQTVVHVSQENRQHMLGHLSLLGLEKPVMPWSSDGSPEDEIASSLETSLAEWADRGRRNGALVVLPHFPSPNGEVSALVATGRADAVEFVDWHQHSHAQYYRFLNAGYRLPLVGGTDKMSADVPVGLARTYARLRDGEQFSYEAWRRAIADGRTFMTTGPLISLEVEGQDVGGFVQIGTGAGSLHVRSTVTSIFPIHTLEIVVGGRVVAAETASVGSTGLSLETSITVQPDTWVVARAAGPEYSVGVRHHDEWRRGVMAHTSPIYIAQSNEWAPRDATVTAEMLEMVDGAMRYIRELSPVWREGVTHRHSHSDHVDHLLEPFLEARDALLRRDGS